MSTPLKLGAFAVAMLVVFGGAMAVGRAFSPDETATPDSAPTWELTTLSDAKAGQQDFEFMTEVDGEPEDDFETVHEKKLHFIAVREDFEGFQHVHPTLDKGSQVWTAPLTLSPGKWRLYADFKPRGDDGQVATATVVVPGNQGPAEDRGISARVDVDGYQVTMPGDLKAGAMTMLTPEVTRSGKAVQLEPYLGASGHLVILQHKTYDYLHVHPEGDTFHTSVTEPGWYELFLQFKHGGKVHTAQFTMKASGEPAGTEMDHDH